MSLDILLKEITDSVNSEVIRLTWARLFDNLKVEDLFIELSKRMFTPIRCNGLDYDENEEPLYK